MVVSALTLLPADDLVGLCLGAFSVFVLVFLNSVLYLQY